MKFFCIILLFTFISSQGWGQKDESVCSVFTTVDEYLNNHPSFFIKNGNGKIRLNDLLSGNSVTVRTGDTSVILARSSLYGFSTCSGNFYRFFGKKELLLLNAHDPILIYKDPYTKVHQGAKLNITNCYFSLQPADELQLLTIKNLKRAFTGNAKFQVLINQFKYNTALCEYDRENREYKIVEVLKESLR